MKRLVLILLILSVCLSCKKADESAEESFGLVLAPEVNVKLMSLNPGHKTLFINESIQYTASGGNAPYTYSLDSGIGSINSTGFYTAPNVAGLAVIKAVDIDGEETFATVNIVAKVSLSPSNQTIGEGETLQFTASGGIPPFTYKVVTGDGFIDSVSGLYDATGVANGSGIIEVTDSAGNSAYSSITVNPSLIITPTNQIISYGEQVSFTASGGNQPYTYSILTGNGSINSTSGVFIGANSSGSTIVRVTDQSNNFVDAVITVIDSPQISKPKEQVGIGRQVTFTTTNGAPPYTYSIISGEGSIHPTTGIFTAGNNSSVSVIQVTDVNNYTDTTSIKTFIPKMLALGAEHTCAIDYSDPSSSIAKCWGRAVNSTSYFGHIPDPNFYIADQPEELGDSIKEINLGDNIQVIGVKLGRYSTCAVTSDYKLKCWGYNNYGQLGQGDRTARGFASKQMGNSLEWVNLGTGRTVNSSIPVEDAINIHHHSVCVILDDNSTRCFGYGGKGKTGHGNQTTYSDSAVEIGDNIPLVDFGSDYPTQIDLGIDHTCALLQDGNVKCWGEAGYGKIGQGNQTDRISKPKDVPAVDLGTGRTAQKVCTGYYHSCALLDSGDVKCWGRNNYGQLGQGHNQSLGDGPGEMGDNLLAIDLGTGKTATDIACMNQSNCAILNDGSVKCWGYNGYGQLGQGSTTTIGDAVTEMGDNLNPVDLGIGRQATKLYEGMYQMCARLDTGSFKCWGRNNAAQLAQGHRYDIGKSALALGDNLQAINISSNQSIIMMQAHEYHACAVLSNNTLKCWGRDYNGARGTGDSLIGDDSSDMGTNLLNLNHGSHAHFKDIKTYLYSTCGLNTDNKLACWGYGGNGARASGNGSSYGFRLIEDWGENLDFVNFGTNRTVQSFDMGYRGGCAILDNNEVACWGLNNYGQLGIGNKTNKGDSASEVGDNFVFSDMGSISTPVQVSRATSHTCTRFSNGKVKCWGRNHRGQLGLGNTTQKGDGANEMGDNLPFIDLGAGISSQNICTGEDFTCSLFDNDKVKCWGESARIGVGSSVELGDGANEMGDNLPFLDFGSSRSAKQLSCGRYHACVILDNETMKCWGNNNYGGLGQGNITNIGDNPGEMGDNLPAINLGQDKHVLNMELGQYHTCAILDDDSIKCWGINTGSQLGLGHTTNMGTLDVTMGDSLPKVEFK